MSEATVPPYAVQNDQMISGFFGDYRYLSNFWPAKVEFLGLEFGSTEAAYQAAKCADTNDVLHFVTLYPKEAKTLGQKIKKKDNWEDIKNRIMFYVVFQKFSRHPRLTEKLLATGNRTLIEANDWGDNCWGEAYRKNDAGIYYKVGCGENRLGRILMHVRECLQ